MLAVADDDAESCCALLAPAALSGFDSVICDDVTLGGTLLLFSALDSVRC